MPQCDAILWVSLLCGSSLRPISKLASVKIQLLNREASKIKPARCFFLEDKKSGCEVKIQRVELEITGAKPLLKPLQTVKPTTWRCSYEGEGGAQLKKQKLTIWQSHRYLTKQNRVHS